MNLIDKVRTATTEADVVAAAKAYVESWPAPVLEKLPPPARGPILDADDIIFGYISLRQERSLRQDAGKPITSELQTMSDFYRAAAHSIRRISGR